MSLKICDEVNDLVKKSTDPWGMNNDNFESQSSNKNIINLLLLSLNSFSISHFGLGIKFVKNKIISYLPSVVNDVLFFLFPSHKAPQSVFLQKQAMIN